MRLTYTVSPTLSKTNIQAVVDEINSFDVVQAEVVPTTTYQTAMKPEIDIYLPDETTHQEVFMLGALIHSLTIKHRP
jgi:hypothetical protein